LVCPYRALQHTLLRDVVSTLFGRIDGERLIIPASSLTKQETREDVLRALKSGVEPVVFLQDKLGGEISISKTDKSPEMSFDITLVQLEKQGDCVDVASFGILEVQTMDFHGSYRAAVKNLLDALRLHKDSFSIALEQNPEWAGERVEGPNISNVFKRTFYQMMLKFRIGSLDSCRGCVLALPESVWDSWQRHLGGPELVSRADGCFELSAPGQSIPAQPDAWIYVFDVDSKSTITPNPIVVRKRIATSTEAIAHYALKVAPEAAFDKPGGINLIPERIKLRLSRFWPDIWADLPGLTGRS
jgi:hypothetical protein